MAHRCAIASTSTTGKHSSMTDETDKPKPYTEADLLREFGKRQEKKTRAQELISSPDAPFVLAPRSMWKGKTAGPGEFVYRVKPKRQSRRALVAQHLIDLDRKRRGEV
jgi:hypothetical protein